MPERMNGPTSSAYGTVGVETAAIQPSPIACSASPTPMIRGPPMRSDSAPAIGATKIGIAVHGRMRRPAPKRRVALHGLEELRQQEDRAEHPEEHEQRGDVRLRERAVPEEAHRQHRRRGPQLPERRTAPREPRRRGARRRSPGFPSRRCSRGRAPRRCRTGRRSRGRGRAGRAPRSGRGSRRAAARRAGSARGRSGRSARRSTARRCPGRSRRRRAGRARRRGRRCRPRRRAQARASRRARRR